MKKDKYINALNKILKSKSIPAADKKAIRGVIKELSNEKVDWLKIILALSKLAGLSIVIYKILNE